MAKTANVCCHRRIVLWSSKHEDEHPDGEQKHDGCGGDKEQPHVEKSSDPHREYRRRELQQTRHGADSQQHLVQPAEISGRELAVQAAGHDVEHQQKQIDQSVWQRIYLLFRVLKTWFRAEPCFEFI